MLNEPNYPDIMSIADLARALNMSRSRLYQLVKAGIFLPPCYEIRSRRPFYPREIYVLNIEARRRNCGVNGRPILFYAKPQRQVPIIAKSRPASSPRRTESSPRYPELVDALKGLGLESVTPALVGEAVKSLYPEGVTEITGEVIRQVFLFVKRRGRQNTSDNVGR